MRSRAGRITAAACALIAIAAAAAFLFSSEKQITTATGALRVFDRRAREAVDALADVRAGQQAYVAAGQGVTFWMPKVSATTDAVTSEVGDLRRSASSAAARAALDEAAATINEFAGIDKRTRDYVKSGQQLMAGDVIFTEGVEAAAAAARQVESARLAEHQDFDAFEARLRRQQVMATGGAAGLVFLIVLLLVPVSRRPAARPSAEAAELARPSATSKPASADQAEHAAGAEQARPLGLSGGSAGPVMRSAADLATEFGRVRDLEDLARLLGRAAELMDASGVVVWIGNTTGADLRPALSHGYSPQVAARMPSVPRSADNAAAAAYRTGQLQIVVSRPGGASGAIVAPILTADGCVGVFSAEIRSGGETSETVQALAAIFAAQLASIVASQPAETTEPKAARQ